MSRKFREIKFKPKSFYTSAKNYNRKEYGEEFRRLKSLLKRRIYGLTNYRVPEKYKELVETYTKQLSDTQLFQEVRHLYNILNNQDRFNQQKINARRRELTLKFEEYGVNEENYDLFFDFLDSVRAIMADTAYDSTEAMEYFHNNLSDLSNTEDVNPIIIAREFEAYIFDLESGE